MLSKVLVKQDALLLYSVTVILAFKVVIVKQFHGVIKQMESQVRTMRFQKVSKNWEAPLRN